MSRARCCRPRTRISPSEGSHHVNDFEVAVGEGDGVGRGGHWQHEGQRGGDGAGEHDVQRVNPDGCGLPESETQQAAQLTPQQRPLQQEVTERHTIFSAL